jgi:lysophospholipase L1-like esterase
LGWGDPIANWFDPAKIVVLNRALGGRRSRSFLIEGLWDKVLGDRRPGDFVLMQFGHNDGGSLTDGRGRASLKGTGPETSVITNQTTGTIETVHTYGWYMRKYIADAKAKVATPIVLSLVPRKIWKDGKIARGNNDYTKWAGEAANAEEAAFVDLNDIVARHYEELGPEKVNALFGDEHPHTNEGGANLNAQCVLEGLRALKNCELVKYLAESGRGQPRPRSEGGEGEQSGTWPSPPQSLAPASDYAFGADLSFLKQAEDRGGVFKDSGEAKPGLQIFKDHGYNWVRLRLFHTPTRLPNTQEYTIALAKDAKKLGFRFLLDFHYSDTWADPAKQFLPKAWEGKSHAELVQAVFEYTRDTIAAFRQASVLPDMVQPGNEIIHGLLWPDGKLPEHWDNFAELVKAGIRGVEAGRGEGPRPRIMIHIDGGGDLKGTKWFFDKLSSYDVAYDVIGQFTIRGGMELCSTCARTLRSWPRPTRKTSSWLKPLTVGGPRNTEPNRLRFPRRPRAKESSSRKSAGSCSRLRISGAKACSGGNRRWRLVSGVEACLITNAMRWRSSLSPTSATRSNTGDDLISRSPATLRLICQELLYCSNENQ